MTAIGEGSAVAAPGDTWGIPGPTFLTFYLITAVVVLIGVIIARAAIFAGRPATDNLGPLEAAYLSGGETLAVYASIAGLRVAGAIGAAPVGAVNERALAVSGPLPPGMTPLDHAIYQAARQQCPTQYLTGDFAVAAALTEIRSRLEMSGLLLSNDRVRSARQATAVLFVVAAVGYARIVSGMVNDRPVRNLVVVTAALTVLALIMLARKPARTRAATSTLDTLRTRNRHLSPAQSPSWVTYGAAGTAMAVGIYGVGSMWAMDPAFAAEAGLRQHVPAYGGSTGGSSGSSSDGGSSSSGDSGGGSSCGGGGGCGGGGCGG